MTNVISSADLDVILALQVTVAWAGEGRSTRRLGWWQTDLVDEGGGGDFFRRLLPRTHAWAALEAVREAARRKDTQKRLALAEPDNLRTLFFWGFEVDERLGDRLGSFKREGMAPAEVLPLPFSLDGAFSRPALEAALAPPGTVAPRYKVIPNARQLEGRPPTEPTVLARSLVAALLPLTNGYPAPFYRVGG